MTKCRTDASLSNGVRQRDTVSCNTHQYVILYNRAKNVIRTQIHTVCQDITDFLDEAARLDAIITDFLIEKKIYLVLHDWLLKKITVSGVDSRVVVRFREFLLGRSQRVKVGRQHSEEVRMTSGLSQGSV